MQNLHESKLLLPKITESVVSMPPMPMNIHYIQQRNVDQQQKPKTQMSELVNYDRNPNQMFVKQMQGESRMNETSHQTHHLQQLQMRQQITQPPAHQNNLNIEYKESTMSRDAPAQGVLSMNTPPKRGKDDHYSIGSSNFGATAKFGNISDTHSRKQTMGAIMKDPTAEYETRLQEEKMKIKEEFEMQQLDLQKKMNDQMQLMHQMMFEQQKQMQQTFTINQPLPQSQKQPSNKF